jgi:signal transduction histidine kinase
LIERIPAAVMLEVNNDRRCSAQAETAGYYVVAEALSNALRHAAARQLSVAISFGRDTVEVTIVDDGLGGADPTSDGLRSLADRVAAVGGTLTIVSPPGRGTSVKAQLPCGS